MSTTHPFDRPLTAEQFIDQYYDPRQLRSEDGKRDRIVATALKELKSEGRAFITRHASVTGERVILINPNWRPVEYLRWLVEA